MRIAGVSRVIHAPVGEIWAVTSSFGNIRSWMPGVIKVSVEGAGIGAVRYVQLPSGIAKETLLKVDPDCHSIRYSVEMEGGLAGLVGGTDLIALSPERTPIEWMAEIDDASADISEMTEMLGDFFAAGIAGIGQLLGAQVE